MKKHLLISLLAFWSLSIVQLSAETPPQNDDFINATLLSGDDFTATSEVHCATLSEDEPPFSRFASPANAALLDSLTGRTVWWKWQTAAGISQSGLQLTLTSTAPPSNSYITHVEVFEENGTALIFKHLHYIGIDQPFLVSPNKTYYFRAFYAADPGKTQPDTVSLTLSGTRHLLTTNRDLASSIVLEGNTIPQLYARPFTNLFFTWTPDTSGFVELKNEAPFSARATVYPEGESFQALDGPVTAGETYTLVFYTSSTTQNPVVTGGDLTFLPAAANSIFATRKPATETVLADRTEVSLEAAGHGRRFWWTWTPTEDGLLKTNIIGSFPLLQPEVYENEQDTNPLTIIRSSVSVTANTTYTISLRTNTGQLTNDVEQLFSFYPLSDSVTITDPQLANALSLAFNIPGDTKIPRAFLTDLSNLRIKAFRDCDDDDCGGPPGFVISDLDGLEHASNLDSLYLQGGEYKGHSVSSLAPIKGLTNLETLRLPNALKGTDEQLQSAIEDLSTLEKLSWLSLEQNKITNAHLSPIASLTRLETLDIDDNLVSDLTPLSGLTLLRRLDIDDNPLLDLSPLSSLQSLRDLDVNPIRNGFSSLPPLRDLRTLKVISDDLGPLARLTNLQQIHLPNSSKLRTPSRLRDLTPIANLPNLTSFSEGHYSNAVRDFRPLSLMNFPYNGSLSSLLSNLVHNSKADISDPVTAGLFAAADLNPGSIFRTPDDPSLPIPDGKLRWYMSGRPYSSPVQAELETLTYIQGSHVESLIGIGTAPNLRSVRLYDGWITDLSPLSGLRNLSILNLQNNFINDVTPIAHLTEINIDLRGNPINPATIPPAWIDNPLIKLDPFVVQEPEQDIPDPVLRSIIRVALGMQPDAPLSRANLVNLRTLHADFAHIQSLDGLDAAINLTGLSLRNNTLVDLDPIPTEKLRWLRVSGNPLSPASRTLLSSLEDQGVVVDNNEETRFLSAITPSGGVVFADDYQLPSIRYLQLFPEVSTLFFSNNYLTGIAELAELPNLETVYLEGNLLLLDEGAEAGKIVADLRARGVTVYLNPQRPETSGDFFVTQEELREATADGLNLPFVPPSFSSEQLESIVNFDWEDSVGSVPLNDPSLISKMTNLEFLSLEDAGLSDLTFLEGLTKLQRLDLDFNSISDLTPLAEMTNLRELDLNDNQITDISPLANFTELIALDLDHNAISSVQAISELDKLIELELHYNKIPDITPITALDNLEWLNITQNGIDYRQADQAAAFDTFESILEFPILYPQWQAQARLAVEGTRVRLNWTGEQQTYYQVLFSPDLKAPFTHYRTTGVGRETAEIEIEIETARRKGFFQINPIPYLYPY